MWLPNASPGRVCVTDFDIRLSKAFGQSEQPLFIRKDFVGERKVLDKVFPTL